MASLGKLDEKTWWENFSDITTKQWELTAELNSVVRKAYLKEMKDHLLVPGGRLLEIGCGSGWVGMCVASGQMSLTGIDTSPQQIGKARYLAQTKNLEDVQFMVGSLSDLDPTEKYHSVLMHAVLHHMSEPEVEQLLSQVQEISACDGRIYIYEPLESVRSSGPAYALALVVFLFLWSPWWALQKLGVLFKAGPSYFRDAVRRGWTGLSPNERPLRREWLLETLARGYDADQVRYWHAYSLALAMGCSELKSPLSQLSVLLVRVLYRFDQYLLQSRLRDYILGVWTFASIRAKRRGPEAPRIEKTGEVPDVGRTIGCR